MRMRVLLLLVVMLLGCGSLTGGEGKLTLGDQSVPFPVRQDKAYRLLRSWEFVAPEVTSLLSINDEERLARVETALATLDTRANGLEAACALTSATEKYLVASVLRWQTIDSLDFSEDKLRHFFRINPAKYSCEPRAGVAEFVVPREYVESSDGGSDVLDRIRKRLEMEGFARVSHDVTSKFTAPTTGFRGTITESEARPGYWEHYRAAWNDDHQGIGGPYEIEEGYLFVRVHSFLEGENECFRFYRDQVARDYGRVWLEKIHRDTMTTITRELKPDVRGVTTAPLRSEVAFVVDGHATTFEEARAMLAFLRGDERTIPFWESIQNQALELELIYRSRRGSEVRDSNVFKRLSNVLCVLQGGQKQLDEKMGKGINDKELKDWFVSNSSRFAKPGQISYALVRCESTTNSAVCSAFLEGLAKGGPELESLPDDGLAVVHEENVVWSQLPVPVQVATQDIAAGEWSRVFSLDGEPVVVRLREKEVSLPDFEENIDLIRSEYEIAARETFWRDFLGLE